MHGHATRGRAAGLVLLVAGAWQLPEAVPFLTSGSDDGVAPLALGIAMLLAPVLTSVAGGQLATGTGGRGALVVALVLQVVLVAFLGGSETLGLGGAGLALERVAPLLVVLLLRETGAIERTVSWRHELGTLFVVMGASQLVHAVVRAWLASSVLAEVTAGSTVVASVSIGTGVIVAVLFVMIGRGLPARAVTVARHTRWLVGLVVVAHAASLCASLVVLRDVPLPPLTYARIVAVDLASLVVPVALALLVRSAVHSDEREPRDEAPGGPALLRWAAAWCAPILLARAVSPALTDYGAGVVPGTRGVMLRIGLVLLALVFTGLASTTSRSSRVALGLASIASLGGAILLVAYVATVASLEASERILVTGLVSSLPLALFIVGGIVMARSLRTEA